MKSPNFRTLTLNRTITAGFLATWAVILTVAPTATFLAPSVWADDGAEHRAAQSRPIELGTSGGNINDIGALYCCSGTLGALTVDGAGVHHILSNNHVLARSNQAAAGEPISQPGMIDQQCGQTGLVADLSAFVPIQFRKGRGGSGPTNTVDAAIARAGEGSVRSDGAILDIGTISPNTTAAILNQSVQKSGRTTGHTFGTVSAINVTVDVGYSTECGGAANQLARFVDQIRIGSGAFSAGGDSGSLILEADATDPENGLPRAVGLLFAGSSSSTLANPIDAVLAGLGVSLVGGVPSDPPITGSITGAVNRAADGAPIDGAAVTLDTGAYATTAADGSYTLTDVPVGSRSVTASAVGYSSQFVAAPVEENLVTEVDFALDELTNPTQAVVECVTYSTSGGPGNDKHLYITVLVVDDFGAALSGAQVTLSVTLNGGAFGSVTGTTGANGEASVVSRNAPNGTYATTVTNVVKNALTFEGSTPANTFAKGVDASPAGFCRSGISGATTGGDGPGRSNAALAHAQAVQARNSQNLFNLPDVVGHGIGLEADQPVIEVYLNRENANARAQAPANLEGVPVRLVVTGTFEAF